MVIESISKIRPHILAASEALRSVLSSGEFKYYVLPIVFLRLLPGHIRSNYDNIIVNEIEKIGLLDDIDDLFFKKTTPRIGSNINYILEKVETYFPILSGVFQATDFSSHHLGDERQRADILHRIIRSISEISAHFTGNVRLEPGAASIFNDCITILVEQSRDSTEFVTPPEVSALVSRLSVTDESRNFYDPACGTGSLLIACANEARRLHKSHVALYGQEKNGAAWAIAKMNLFFGDSNSYVVSLEDSLRFPPTNKNESKGLRQFDIAVSNPPWTFKDWGVDIAETDPHKRFEIGVPSKSGGDYAFILHMLGVVSRKHGQLAIIVSNGTLSKSGNDGNIRRKLIELNLVDSIIALPQKLFFNTNIATNIFILKHNRIRNDILFVDATDGYLPLKNRNKLSIQAADSIVELYRERKYVEGKSKLAYFDEVQHNDFDLSVIRYISKKEAEERIDLNELREKRRSIEQDIDRLNNKLKYAINIAERLAKERQSKLL